MPATTPLDLRITGSRGRKNWDFGGTTNLKELKACCYWEYARESATLRQLREHYVKLWRSTGTLGLWPGSAPELKQIQLADWTTTLFVHSFLSDAPPGWWQSADPSKGNYRPPNAPPVSGSFPKPWRSLSQGEQLFLSKLPTKEADWRAVFRSRHWTDAQKILKVAPSRCIDSDGVELFVAEIRWTFPEKRVVRAFRQWFEDSKRSWRLKEFRSRKGKPGGTVNYNSALRCLARMRVFSRYSATEVDRTSHPCHALWDKRYARDHGHAREIFHLLFPMLKDEEPLSWKALTK